MIILVVLVILAAIGLTFGNLQLLKSNQGGEDFQTHLQAARVFLDQGTSPYPQLESEESLSTTQESSTQTEGVTRTPTPEFAGAADDAQATDPQVTQPVVPGTTTEESNSQVQVGTQPSAENSTFRSPLYVLLVYVPLALIKDPDLAHAIWMTTLELLLIYVGFASVRWIRWKRPLLISFLLMLYTLFTYTSFSSILNGSMSIFSLACMVLVITAMKRGQDEIAGIALALSLFSPETAYVTVLFLLVWSVINNRRSVLFWFLGVLLLLVGFSMLLIPDWVPQYVRMMFPIGGNNPGNAGILATSGFGGINLRLTIAKNAILLIVLVVEWFVVRTRNPLRLVWVTLLSMALSIWIGVNVNPDASLFILPAVLFALSLFYARWKESSYPTMSLVLMLLFGLGWIFSSFVFGSTDAMPVVIMNGIVLPGLGVLLLYWSRWWILYSTSQNLE